MDDTATAVPVPQKPLSMSPYSSAAAEDLPPDRLRRFAASLRELGRARDIDETLQLMVDLAAELIRGIDVADVMFVRSGRLSTAVTSHELSAKVDQVQQETGQGPCLSALHDQAFVVSHDLEKEERWPDFTPRALELGVRSVAAYGLFRERENGEDRYGALNMFGRQPGLDASNVELGGVFAAHCSAVLAGAINEEGLQIALISRDVIGQAKGILMERHRVTPEQAYAMLRRSSMDRNTKVRDLARTVAETGDLP